MQVKPLHKMPGKGMAIQIGVNHDGIENVRYLSSPVARKPVFGVSDQVQHKPSCTATEDDLSLKFRI